MFEDTKNRQSLDELLARPWSREVVADEDSVFIASVPELEGCFADGDSVEEALRNLERVLRDWLELAIEAGEAIPDSRKQESHAYSGRFSVRVPRSLHRDLSRRADLEGSSLNQLIAVLLAESLRSQEVESAASSQVRNAREDIHEAIAADAVAGTQTSIGALKGIATFLRDRGDLNSASLMFAVAADRIATIEGADAASNELGVAAAFARRNARMRLAEALWRESLRRNPSNLRSSSALGQLLHHQGRYVEAANYLELASAIDNHALLFLGWSLFMAGHENDDPHSIQRGRMSIEKALQEWSYQNRDVAQRDAWLKHIHRLGSIQDVPREEIEALIAFANANSGWPKLDATEIVAGPETLTVEPDQAGVG
jgi:antitoxin HicB